MVFSIPWLTDNARMARGKSAIIVGGGIVGVTGAYALARDGWQILDRLPNVALAASFGNGRQLSYSHTNALASPGIIKQIPRLALGCDDAFRVRLKADIHFASWLWQFLRNCTAGRNRHNTLAALELAEQSRKAMARLQQRHPIEFDRRTTGKFVLLRGQQELQNAMASVAAKREKGVDQNLLTPEEVFDVEPALANCAEPIDGAVFTASDESGDCNRFASGLLKVIEAEYGVQFRSNSEAVRIESTATKRVVKLVSGETLASDLVVVSSGHKSNDLLAPMGLRLAIEPMKGYSFTAPVGNLAPVASVTDNKRRIVFTNLGDRMLVAGIAEMGRVDQHLDKERLASMIAAARATLPEAAVYTEADQGWTGMRPMTPDSLPIIRMLAPGIVANTGHGMLGWTMAMGSAERLAQVVRKAS